MPDKKKQKLNLESDGTVIFSTFQNSFQEKAGSSKETKVPGFYIESQGEYSIKKN